MCHGNGRHACAGLLTFGIGFISRRRKLTCAVLDKHMLGVIDIKKMFFLFFNLNIYSATGATLLYYAIVNGLCNGLNGLKQSNLILMIKYFFLFFRLVLSDHAYIFKGVNQIVRKHHVFLGIFYPCDFFTPPPPGNKGTFLHLIIVTCMT